MRVIGTSLATFSALMAALPVPLHAWTHHQAVVGLPPPLDRRSPLPVPNSTRSFWFTDSHVRPAPNEGSEGPLTGDADICIIGSGITGVSAAYHFAKAFRDDVSAVGRPVSAVVLEARDFCSGATGRNGGHLTAHKYAEFRRLQKERGIDEALRTLAIERHTVDELIKVVQEDGKEDYVDLTHGGRLMLMFSDEELAEAKADYEAAKAAGIDMSDVQWLSKQEVWKKYGAPYAGVLTPGNNLWPLKAAGLLFELANQSPNHFSVRIHTHTPVISITPLPFTHSSPDHPFPRRHTMATPKGSLTCSYVLHATNAYVSHLLPHMSGPNGVIPTRGQVMAVRAGVGADQLTTVGGTGNEGFEYWFPRPLKSKTEITPLVIVGGGREVAKGFELYEVNDSIVNKEVGRALREFLPAAFPEKYEKDREPEMEWTGIMGYTRSGDPFVGPVVDPKRPDDPRYEGEYVSAGYTGHGMPRAFSCAEVVVGMIVADVHNRSWHVPPWFPRSYLTSS